MRLILSVVLAVTATVAASPGYDLVEQLFSRDAAVRAQARDTLIERNDPSLAAALVDAVFFNTVGRVETIAVLESLLGDKHGAAYKKWVELIGRREDLTPAPGYVAFKARQVAKIDPALAGFLREDAPRTIRPEEIVWGGVRKDGIPALSNPDFVAASRATWMAPEETVFGVVIAGDARAYPERILAWHEMANDRVGGRAVTLSYCTLCGAAILYDGQASDGRTYTFGSSGFLYRSNKLMYDRQTETLWSQLTGAPVFGSLAKKLAPLRVLPVTVTTWREWVTVQPRTRVLSLETGYERDYRPGAAYGKYFASPDTMFPVWKKPSRTDLAPKDWVLIVNIDAARKIYPIKEIERLGLLHDRVGGQEIVLVGERAYLGKGRRFRRDGSELVDDRSERFTIREEWLVSSSGERLPRVPSHRAFWFGAYALYPGTELWQRENE